MERPGRTDHGIKQAAVRLNTQKQAEHPVSGDRENAVEREEIRGQRDPEVISVCHHKPAIASDAKPADPTAHQQNPERMGQFMPEDINESRARQAEESDQPDDRAQGEEPKFFAGPKPLCYRRARKDSEKRLTKNCAK